MTEPYTSFSNSPSLLCRSCPKIAKIYEKNIDVFTVLKIGISSVCLHKTEVFGKYWRGGKNLFL